MLEVTAIFKLLLIREAPAMTVTEQHRIDKRATNTANTSQVNIVATDKSITQFAPKTRYFYSFLLGVCNIVSRRIANFYIQLSSFTDKGKGRSSPLNLSLSVIN